MPTLQRIIVQDFRNIEMQEIEFSPNVNCISGGNGEGKTNLLDAIYYLSMTKSAQGGNDKFNFRHGQGSFAIGGSYLMSNGTKSDFSIEVNADGEKKLRRDGKPCPRVSDHIGRLPIVLVSPSDISMVSESGEERRRFVNAVLSQMDASYLSAIQQYNRMLLQRNRLLKNPSPDPELISVFDAGMAPVALTIHEKRKKFCEELLPTVKEYYNAISGGHEDVSIEYVSDLEKAGLEEILASHRDRDLALRYTSCGIHRDDFIFTMDGHPIRKCGSQGQQKSFLVALKFAQYEIMKQVYGFPPILLLDDLFDKLDMNRVANLLKMVAGNDFGQIFLSDSNKVRISALVDGITADRCYLRAEAGKFINASDDEQN